MSAAAARKIAIDLDLHLAIESVYNERVVSVYRCLLGAFSFVPLSEFVGRPSWTKSG